MQFGPGLLWKKSDNLKVNIAPATAKLIVVDKTLTLPDDAYFGVEEGKSTTLQTVTASLEGRLNNVETTTSSHDDRLSNLETSTGSSDVSLTNVHSFTSSFNTAITLDSTNVTVLGNLTVQGSQTQLNTQTLNI